MPRREDDSVLGMSVTHEERERVKDAAKAKGYKSVSDYMRDLLRRDGVELEDRQWGGEREKGAEIVMVSEAPFWKGVKVTP